MRVLGINAIFHDPAAALVVDGRVVAAADEDRFGRVTAAAEEDRFGRVTAKAEQGRAVPDPAGELPGAAAAWCLREAGLGPADLDLVGYSFDPGLGQAAAALGLDDPADHRRMEFARRAPQLLAAALPGLDRHRVRFVPHHVAHAAAAGRSVPEDNAVLVLDGRGEIAGHLAGVYSDGRLQVLRSQQLPHSLGTLYAELSRHLRFLPSSDGYEVSALAAYGTPRFLGVMRELVRVTGDGGFSVARIDWNALTVGRPVGGEVTSAHADLAASVLGRVEEVVLGLARWTYEAAGRPDTLTMAGDTALTAMASARVAAEGPFGRVLVPPAGGDCGAALGAALALCDRVEPFSTAALGRSWADDEVRRPAGRVAGKETASP